MDSKILKWRCCFCIPIRTELIIWALINLLYNATFLFLLIVLIALSQGLMLGYGAKRRKIITADEATLSLITFSEVIYNAILIVSLVFSKCLKLLKYSYYFGTLLWIITIGYGACVCVRLNHFIDSDWSTDIISIYATCLAVFIVQILINVYILLLLRREILKLRVQYQRVEFVNVESRAGCDNSIFERCPDNELLVRDEI